MTRAKTIALMTAVLCAISAVTLPPVEAHTSTSTAPYGTVRVFARIPAPGHPYGVLPTRRGVYVTTSSGSSFCRGRGEDAVFLYPANGGAPVAKASVNTMPDMGLFGAAQDAEGRIYVVDMNGRVLRFNTGEHGLVDPQLYATLPEPFKTLGWTSSMWMVPVFDRAGSLYVTDASQGAIWRIPPNGAPSIWFQDPRLRSVQLSGLNGITVGPDAKLYFALPGQGQIYRLPLTSEPSSAQLELFHQFPMQPGARDTPVPGPSDVTFGRSGKVYVTLTSANRIAVLASDGTELRQITNDAFDWPLSLRFNGRSLLVTNTHYLQSNETCSAGQPVGEVLRVQVDETGLAPIQPHISA